MARHYWGIDKSTGSGFGVVTTGTSSTNLSVEISTDDSDSVSRAELVALANRLIRYIAYEDTASPLKP
jgi:hypothetical protein